MRAWHENERQLEETNYIPVVPSDGEMGSESADPWLAAATWQEVLEEEAFGAPARKSVFDREEAELPPADPTSLTSNPVALPSTTAPDTSRELSPGAQGVPKPTLPSDAASLGRSSAIMAAGTLVSRVLGVLRSMLLVTAIGLTGSKAAEAFSVANKLPNQINMVIAGGLLNAVLVPQIVRALRSKDGGREYVNKMLTVAGVLLLGLTLIVTALAAVFVLIFAAKMEPEARTLATMFAFWCIPQVFFYGLYTLLGQVLNARGSFGPYMWAPVVNNIVAIASLGVFIAMFGSFQGGGAGHPLDSWSGQKIAVLAGGATLGVAAQALVLIIPMRRSGIHWRPQWGIRGMGFRTAGRVATWTFSAIIMGQLAYTIVSNVAAGAGAESNNAIDVPGNMGYDAAFMIYMLPHSLITVSVMTALFTRLSKYAAVGNLAAVRKDFSLGLRTLSLFTIFATAAMIVLAFPLVVALNGPGSLKSAGSVQYVVITMSIGLTAMGFWSMAQRIFYAFEDARTLFFIQVPMGVILAGGSWLGTIFFDPKWWVAGVGVSMSLSNIFGAACGIWILRLVLKDIDGARVLRLVVRTILAAAVSAVAGFFALKLFGDLSESSWTMNVVALAVGGLAMLAVYGLALYAMRVKELTDAIAMVRRKLPGGKK